MPTDTRDAREYLRKKSVADRYDICPRTVDRATRAGRLPAPEFPLGNKVPMWSRRKLDEHDRRLLVDRLDIASTTDIT
jgi:hypothetical protein